MVLPVVAVEDQAHYVSLTRAKLEWEGAESGALKIKTLVYFGAVVLLWKSPILRYQMSEKPSFAQLGQRLDVESPPVNAREMPVVVQRAAKHQGQMGIGSSHVVAPLRPYHFDSLGKTRLATEASTEGMDTGPAFRFARIWPQGRQYIWL